MTDASTALLVVDALRGIDGVTPVLAELPVPKRAERAISREEVEALLREWEEDFIGGKAAATVRAVRSDWQQYILWCEGTGTAPLPLSLKDILAFVDNAIDRGRKRSTINRYLFTIGKIHTVAGLPNPVQDPKFAVKFAARVKRLVKDGKNTAEQAAELTLKDIDQIQAALNPERLSDLRDAALIALAGDTLCRESELAAVMLEHFIPNAHDDAVVLDVRKSKTNREGAHDYRFVSPETWSRIQTWCDRAKIRSGFVFLTVSGRKRAPTPDEADALAALAKANGTEPPSAPRLPMLAQEIARILRKRAVQAALPQAGRVSGHSTRVGMANELARMGASERDLMDAGGWNSAQSVKRYTAQSQVGLGARAKLHEKHQSARGAADAVASPRASAQAGAASTTDLDRPQDADRPKVHRDRVPPKACRTRINISVIVQSRSKFTRGRSKAEREIASAIRGFQYQAVHTTPRGDYEVDITHADAADLNEKVDELVDLMHSIPDRYNCEAEISIVIVGTDRYWDEYRRRFRDDDTDD